MSTAMTGLLYVSRGLMGSGQHADEALREILDVSRINNTRDGITGALLFAQDCFAQILEGPTEAVERTAARIRLDPRHRDCLVLTSSIIVERRFPNWSMAFNHRAADVENAATGLFQRAFAGGDAYVAREVAELIEQSVALVQIW